MKWVRATPGTPEGGVVWTLGSSHPPSKRNRRCSITRSPRRTIRHRRPAATGAIGAGDRPRPRSCALQHRARGLTQPPRRSRLPRLHRLRAHSRHCAVARAAQQPLRRAGVVARRAAHRPRLEPRAGIRLAAAARLLSISHETIYLRVRHDKQDGGELWRHMRQALEEAQTPPRPRAARATRGQTAHLGAAGGRCRGAVVGHWEIDTVKGDNQACHSASSRWSSAPPATSMSASSHATTPPMRPAAPSRGRPPPGVPTSPPTTAPSSTTTPMSRRPAARSSTSPPRTTPGARHQREHQRAATPVPAQAPQHGAHHPARPRCDRAQTQLSTTKAARLPDTGGVLCTIRRRASEGRCCDSNLNSGCGIAASRRRAAARRSRS